MKKLGLNFVHCSAGSPDIGCIEINDKYYHEIEYKRQSYDRVGHLNVKYQMRIDIF